jgi:hypothetical protein
MKFQIIFRKPNWMHLLLPDHIHGIVIINRRCRGYGSPYMVYLTDFLVYLTDFLVYLTDFLIYLTDFLIYLCDILVYLADSLVYLADSLVYICKKNENLTDSIVYSARFWFISPRFSFISAR